jgi:thiamine biosynthesis lipoprotein
MKRILFLLAVISIISCTTTPSEPVIETQLYSLIGGKTMGTTYSAKFDGDNTKEINDALDSLFLEINMAVSTYIDSSSISKFNQNREMKTSMKDDKHHFRTNYLKSREVYIKTDSLFDPTVMPLVNYWGFGYDGKKEITAIDKNEIESILYYVGFWKTAVSAEKTDSIYVLMKLRHKTELDFSAIAKGYGADQAGKLLESKGIKNYLIEIGGEVYTKGLNEAGKPWVIGVNTPKEEAKIHEFEAYVGLSGKGMATSGNYRNYYEIDGEKFSHTINPKTGFPERSNLLSATIIADDCMTADAYATACMVAGLEKAIEIINNDDSLEGYFIFADKSGTLQSKYTEGFKPYLLD